MRREFFVGASYDFVGKRKYFAIFSTLMVLASMALFFVKGANWGIDFTGGTELHLKFTDLDDIGELRGALIDMGLSPDSVQRVGSPDDREFVVRIQDPTFGTEGLEEKVLAALRARFGPEWVAESTFDAQVGARLTIRYAGDEVPIAAVEQALSSLDGASVQQALDENTVYVKLPGLSSSIEGAIRGKLPGRAFEILQVDSVGPKVGAELRTQGAVAIAATLALILVYVAFRFDLAFAPGAVVALFHDVWVTIGIFVLFGLPFDLPMIGALLTIIGYSLNDTIVIYDRIREKVARYRRRDMARLINDSVNETLTRTLATSGTTIVAMLAFLFLGGPVIEHFALAIIIGIVFGTYSTVYVASPMILVMEDVRPWLTRLVAPLASRVTAGPEQPAGEASEGRRRTRRPRGPDAPAGSG